MLINVVSLKTAVDWLQPATMEESMTHSHFEDTDFLPDDYEEALEIVLPIVRTHRHIENCRRYPRTVASWLMYNHKTVPGIKKLVQEAGRLERGRSDLDGSPGLSDPKEPCHDHGDQWGGERVDYVFTPYGIGERLISQW